MSAGIGFAAVNSSEAFFTQIFLVPLYGLIKLMNLPFGESWAPDISGSPKNISRSISGGCPDFFFFSTFLLFFMTKYFLLFTKKSRDICEKVTAI